jgi:hypothetical protein
MPGIERAAPERTETSNGWRRWPKRCSRLLLEEGNSFLEILGESALGILVALHQRGAKVDGQDEGRRNRQPKARNTREVGCLGPNGLGAAPFTCSSLDPHDAHGCTRLFGQLAHDMGVQHMADEREPIARPLERASELECDEAALA